MSTDDIAAAVESLDLSIQTGTEHKDGKTVVSGLYAIADELAKLTKMVQSIARGGAL